MKDLTQIREQFPIFNRLINNKPIVYLDNSCMSLRPRVVIDAMNNYYENLSACAGRSNHILASEVNGEVEGAREKVRKLINAKRAEEIVFTRNTTEGINLVANSLGLKSGDVVIISDKEHNSNLVPWQVLVKKVGIKLKIARSLADNTFDLDGFKKLLEEGATLVSLVGTSNLDGVSNPIKEIVNLSHKHQALVMIDGAQSVPHQKIDVVSQDIDFLSFSAHKMCGPSGMGVLYGKYSLLEKLDGFMVGGDTVEFTTYTTHKLLPPPEKFEAGLQNYAGIMGTGAAAEYLMDISYDFIQKRESELNRIVTEGIVDIPNLHIIGPEESDKRGGVVSFYVDGVDSHQVALMLSETANIMVRSGRHCVHSWFEDRNIQTSIRASMYFYNTNEEAGAFVKELMRILQILI